MVFFQEPQENLLKIMHTHLNQVLKKKKLLIIFDFQPINLEKLFKVDVTPQVYTINDLNDEYQKDLFNKKIVFQGIEMSFNELITPNDDLSQLINFETLDNLINDHTLKIGEKIEITNEIKNFYINRSINLPIIDLFRIFKDLSIKCIFAITNISESEFKSLFPENILTETPSKYFILDSSSGIDIDFEFFCQQNSLDIHWVKQSNEEFVWIKSKGKINVLRKYIKKNSLNEKEDILVEDSERNVFLISDTAGMGKSTILTKISNDLKNKNSSSWILKLDLIEFTKQFNQIKSNESLKQILVDQTDIDAFADYLCENFLNLKSDFEKNLLKNYSKNGEKKLFILLDGFDEISPLYEDTVIDFINQIKSIATKIWITTRPLNTKKLENKLMALSFTLKPIKKKDQILYLANKWKNPDQLDRTDIINRAENLIQNLGKIFTSNPLHLYMLADVCKDNNKFSISLSELYDKFIQIKYDIYCIEKKKQDPTNPGVILDNQILYNSFLERHKKFAVFSVLRELENIIEERGNDNSILDIYMSLETRLSSKFLRPKILKKILTQEEIENILSLQINEKTGIIDFIENKFKFVHETFAEYFFSICLMENLEQRNFQEILIEYVLIEDEFDLLREFIDSNVKIKTNNLNFDNFKIEKYFECVHTAAYEGNEQIVRFLVDKLNESEKENLFSSKYKIDSDGYYEYNILLNAGCNGHFEIISYLIEKGYDFNKDFKYILDEVKNNFEFNENKLMNFLITRNFFEINTQDEDGETLAHYFSKREDIEMLEFLRTKKIDFSIKNKFGFTAIESVVKACYNILERPSLSNMKQSYDFLLPSSSYLTLEVKVMLSIHFEDLDNLNEYLNSELIDLNKIVENYGPFSFKACRMGNMEIVKLLKDKGCDFKKKWRIIDNYKYAYNCSNDSKYEYSTLEVANLNKCNNLLDFLIDEIECEISSFTIKNVILYSEISTLEQLLKRNMDPNHIIENKMTPILYIANISKEFFYSDYCEKVKLLVNYGADLLKNDEQTGNALHIAALKNNCDLIITLLEIAITNNMLEKLLMPFNMRNAFQIAFMNFNYGALEILKDYFTNNDDEELLSFLEKNSLYKAKKILLHRVNTRNKIREFQSKNY